MAGESFFTPEDLLEEDQVEDRNQGRWNVRNIPWMQNMLGADFFYKIKTIVSWWNVLNHLLPKNLSPYAPSIKGICNRRGGEGLKSLKTSQDLNLKIRNPKTITEPIWSLHKIENQIGSLIELQTKSTVLHNSNTLYYIIIIMYFKIL